MEKTTFKKKILFSLLAAGLMGSMATSVQAADGQWSIENGAYDLKNATFEGQTRKVYLDNDTVLTNVTFKNNTYTDDGPTGFYLHGGMKGRTANVTFNEVQFIGNKAVNIGTKANIGSAGSGAALFLKGSNIAFNDNVFTGNTVTSTEGAVSYGGALMLDAKIGTDENKQRVYLPTTATFNVTKDATYSGNNVTSENPDAYINTYGGITKTAGGFLHLDRDTHAIFNISEGATLTIGNEDATGNMDSIASSIRVKNGGVQAENTLAKTGTGTLTLNGSLNDFHGEFVQEEGVTNVNKNWTATNAITVKGGTLNLKDLTLGSLAESYQVYNSAAQLVTVQPAEVTKGIVYIGNGGTLKANLIKADSEDSYINLMDGNLVANDIQSNVNAVGGTVSVEAKSIHGTVNVEQGTTLNLGGDLAFAEDTNLSIADGTINLVKGNMSGAINGTGTINLSGATYALNNLNQIGENIHLNLTGTGVISTTSGIIFDTTTQESTTTTSVKSDVANKITFVAGALKLNDAEYSLSDITTYKNALIANKADSKTTVVMTGTLKQEAIPENKVSLDQAASISNSEGVKVELDQVTVSSSKSEVVIGAATGSENADVASEGFAVKSLDLAAPAEGPAKVTINSGKTVTLGGTTGGDLITVAGEAPAALEVKLDSGNIAVGNEAAAENTTYKLAGTVTLSGNSTLAVNKGTLEVATLETTSGTTTLTGAAKVTTLTAQAGAVINVGRNDKAGNLVVETLDLNGGTLFLDPIWENGQPVGDATHFATEDTDVSGKIAVGQNSVATFGGTNEAADSVFAETGLTWGNGAESALSAVYVAAPVTLGAEGAIYADPSLTEETYTSNAPTINGGQVTFNAGSILMVNGGAVKFTTGSDATGVSAAINGITSASINADSKLYVSGATKGESYKILAGTLNGAEFTNLISSNKLLTLEKDADASAGGDVFAVKAVVNEDSAVLNDSALKNIASDVANIESGDELTPAAELIQSIASAETEEEGVNGLNALANFGEMAGSTHGTFRSARLFMDAAQDHLSIAKHTKEFNEDLWANYIHTRESVDGLSLANMDADYEGSYNTFVVGHDFYAKDNMVVGAAVSYGTGKISSRNNAISTKNDAKYYGASVYGRKINGKTAYLADVSYLRGDNDITQFNAETVTGSPKVDAFSVGIKAEQEFATDYGTLIPYAGVRYMHLAQGAYTNSKGFAYDQDNQNLFLIPVGVKLTGETSFRGWNVKPMAEVGVIINTGDKDTDGTVTVDGTSDAVNYTIVNGTSLIGKLGVQAEKNAITLGVAYEYQKSSDTSDNRLMFNVGYRF